MLFSHILAQPLFAQPCESFPRATDDVDTREIRSVQDRAGSVWPMIVLAKVTAVVGLQPRLCSSQVQTMSLGFLSCSKKPLRPCTTGKAVKPRPVSPSLRIHGF